MATQRKERAVDRERGRAGRNHDSIQLSRQEFEKRKVVDTDVWSTYLPRGTLVSVMPTTEMNASVSPR